jgi:hypothetical protein
MAVYNVLLISEQKLKDNTSINENVDSSELRFAIQQSQQIFLQESLGTNLLEKLYQLVDDGTINDPANSNYKGLLNQYVQPTLISYSYYLALDNFWVKFINIGLVQNRSEQGQPVDLKTLQFLKQNAYNQAQFNDQILRRHLVFRSGLYPEYTSGNLNDGQLPPDTDSPFKSSLTLPGGSFYYSRSSWKRNGNFNAMGPLCCDSAFPTWYGHTTNSPGSHS